MAIPPHEQAESRELLKDDVTRFRTRLARYRATVNGMVKRAYEKRRRRFSRVRQADQQGGGRGARAPHRGDHPVRGLPAPLPQRKRWTPDVIFRLAELYFEKSNDEYLLATESYEKELQQVRRGRDSPRRPRRPSRTTRQTIELHRRLIREFPRYRLVDGAYYLLGFCLSEMGETRSRQPGASSRWSAPTATGRPCRRRARGRARADAAARQAARIRRMPALARTGPCCQHRGRTTTASR